MQKSRILAWWIQHSANIQDDVTVTLCHVLKWISFPPWDLYRLTWLTVMKKCGNFLPYSCSFAQSIMIPTLMVKLLSPSNINALKRRLQNICPNFSCRSIAQSWNWKKNSEIYLSLHYLKFSYLYYLNKSLEWNKHPVIFASKVLLLPTAGKTYWNIK